jgi:hypothetical protein
MIRKFSEEYKSIVTTNQEIISYPLTYGLFATFDDHYQPLSSTIKFECRTISISCPDLKILAESLLYKNRLFTITEQEDCRETAQNLVNFIQYLRLIVSYFIFICEKPRCINPMSDPIGSYRIRQNPTGFRQANLSNVPNFTSSRFSYTREHPF